jgi:protein-S-isoprenylcysteine O-methyltransferase Ste14
MLFLFVVVLPFLPLLLSGQWDWWAAWVYGIVSVLAFVISRVFAARSNPGLLAERSRTFQQEDTEPWDKLVSPLVFLGGFLILLVAGLDARFGWSGSFSLPVKLLALCCILAGYALSSYALIENRFFSGVVRIQADREQQVISSGPYCWIRHPGYAGALLANFATPVLLDSGWAFLPVIFTAVVMGIRTSLEDQALQQKLVGYREYAQQVRCRLLPGIW